LLTHLQENDLGNKIEGLLSRITTLGAIFATPPGDVAEQRRRNELTRYAVAPPPSPFPVLISSSKLKGIEGALRSLYGKPEMRRLVDHVHDDEDVSTLLEDLQEAVSHYQVCLLTGILLNADEDNRWCDKRQLTIKGSD